MPDQPPTDHLTEEQRARIDFARRDLEMARATDLGAIPAAGLILVIERLRLRLDDALQLIDEITQQ
jgi:hypothetical protein